MSYQRTLRSLNDSASKLPSGLISTAIGLASATVKRFGSLPPLVGTHATMVVCPALTVSVRARVLPQPPA